MKKIKALLSAGTVKTLCPVTAGAAAGAGTGFLFRDGFPSTGNTKKYPARNVSVIRCRLARNLKRDELE